MPASALRCIDAADSVEGVIERMRTIDAALPADDGIAYFNRLYLKVTEEVLASVEGTRFENDEFLARLDVRFANLFFEAVGADQGEGEMPDAWAPLFENRSRANTLPIQFALAGMNAHINHDLSLAVVDICRELALEPEEETPHYRDFERTNELLAEIQTRIKSWFTTGAIATLDDACGRLDDAMAIWSIGVARRVAWENAQLLWQLDDHPLLRNAYLRTLRRGVDLAGRGFLV